MKSIIYVVLIASLFGCAPKSGVSRDEKLKLYNEILDQIITDNYFQHCISLDVAENIHTDVYQGKIDTATYFKIVDSLKMVRRNTLPKCKLDYATEFQIFRKTHELNDDTKFSLSENLKDTFLINGFADVPVKTIVDTLSQAAQINAKELSLIYLDITPYVKRPNRLYGEGMGVISLSKIYFNKEIDKAVLFYEFNCGPKCGTGEIVFVSKKNGKWTVIEYKRVWDS